MTTWKPGYFVMDHCTTKLRICYRQGAYALFPRRRASNRLVCWEVCEPSDWSTLTILQYIQGKPGSSGNSYAGGTRNKTRTKESREQDASTGQKQNNSKNCDQDKSASIHVVNQQNTEAIMKVKGGVYTFSAVRIRWSLIIRMCWLQWDLEKKRMKMQHSDNQPLVWFLKLHWVAV